MKKVNVFVAIASNGYWGKGSSFMEALINAKVKDPATKVTVKLVQTEKPENVGATNDGGLAYNHEDVIIDICGNTEEYFSLAPLFTVEYCGEYILEAVDKSEDSAKMSKHTMALSDWIGDNS